MAVEKASATTRLPIRTVRIGPQGDARDQTRQWSDVREVGSDGVILVRPDGHIGFRAAKLPPNPADTISAAVDEILSAASIHDTHG